MTVSVAKLVPESARDEFVTTDSNEDNVMGGRLKLASCPGGVACVSVFSSRVTSSSSVPAQVPMTLSGFTEVAGGIEVGDDLDVEFFVAP